VSIAIRDIFQPYVKLLLLTNEVLIGLINLFNLICLFDLNMIRLD